MGPPIRSCRIFWLKGTVPYLVESPRPSRTGASSTDGHGAPGKDLALYRAVDRSGARLDRPSFGHPPTTGWNRGLYGRCGFGHDGRRPNSSPRLGSHPIDPEVGG